ncbi:MAG: glycosyltransferase [Oscillospiraceae bacterium]|jgi:hypothetical protein|nr:glycosyltransferase [Oscillospiraceae bacterium]
MPKVSLIVPAYNAQDTLGACLASLLAQSLDDTEIIVVDDGSTDGTPALLDGLATAHARIRAFHQCNGGGSVARNRGLDEARGDYITFVDADDVLEECLASLHEEAVAYGADILFFGYAAVGAQRTEYPLPEAWLGLRDRAWAQAHMHALAGRLATWGKLYRRGLLDGLRFVPGIVPGQDTLFSGEAVGRASRFGFAPGMPYLYRQRLGSVVHRYWPDREERAARYLAQLDRLRQDTSLDTDIKPLLGELYVDATLGVCVNAFLPGAPQGWWGRWRRIRRFLVCPAARDAMTFARHSASKHYWKRRVLFASLRLGVTSVVYLWARSVAARRTSDAQGAKGDIRT